MFYKVEFNIYNFDFWAGAYDRVRNATNEQLDQVAKRIEDMLGDDIPSDVDINDFVSFECDDIFFPEEDED